MPLQFQSSFRPTHSSDGVACPLAVLWLGQDIRARQCTWHKSVEPSFSNRTNAFDLNFDLPSGSEPKRHFGVEQTTTPKIDQ